MLGLIEMYRAPFRGLSREVWLLSLVSFVNRSGAMVVPFLTLYLTTQKGFDPARAGGLLSLFGAGSLAGITVGARLTDRIGYRPVMLASLIGSGVSLFLLGQLEPGVLFAVAVFTSGFVADAFRPANGAAIAIHSTAAERPRAYGLYRLAINAGWSTGPALGGIIARYDYSLLFIIDGATCLLAAGILARKLRPRPAETPPASAANEAEGTRAPSPWRDRLFVLGLGMLFLQGLIFFQMQSTLPLFLKAERGFGEEVIGVLIAINTVVIVVFEMLLIHRVEHLRPLRVVAVSSLLLRVSTAVGFGLLPVSYSVLAVAATIVIWTVGEMLSSPMMTAWTSLRAVEGNRGRYMGAFGLCYSLAMIVAPLLGTWTYESLGPNAPWWACLAAGSLSCLGFAWLSLRSRSAHQRESA